MTIQRILVAIDDSSDALAAAHLAIEIAAGASATLRVLHLLTDHGLSDLLGEPEAGAAAGGPVTERRTAGARSLLRHVQRLAKRAGVTAEMRLVEGDAGSGILAEARDWGADLVVVGRSSQAGPGAPYIGQQVRQVLEFAQQPVLVVPAPDRPGAGR